MQNLTRTECPVVLSITEVSAASITTEPTIQRNLAPDDRQGTSVDIYARAREIYYRARRQRPVRAASIF